VDTVAKSSHMPKSQRDTLVGAWLDDALSRSPNTGRFQTRPYKARVTCPNENRTTRSFLALFGSLEDYFL